MAVKLTLKNSKVQFKNATGAQLGEGELGLNYHESGPYLQAKGSDGTIHALGGVYVADAAPSNPLSGRWWYDNTTDRLSLYDGTEWHNISTSGGGGVVVEPGDGIAVVTVDGIATVAVDLSTTPNGLSFVNGKLQADVATTSTTGTVKVGTGLSVAADGTLSATGGGGTDQNLGYTPAANQGTVTITGGTDAVIPLPDGTNAGLFTSAEQSKLSGIATGAQVNVATNLGYTPNLDNAGTVTSSTGNNATIPIATSSVAGLFTGTEKQKLAGLSNGVTKITAGTGVTLSPASGVGDVTVNVEFDSLTYRGTVDVTQPVPSEFLGRAALLQDMYMNTGEGKFDATWVAVTNGVTTDTDANPGDLMIYNQTTYDHIPCGAAPSSDSLWAESSSKLYPVTVANNVGIGNQDPQFKLDVTGDLNASNFRIDQLTELPA